MAGRTQLVATLRYSNTCRNHNPELLVLGVATTDAEAPFHSCYPKVFEYLQKSLPRAISAGSGHDRRRGAIPLSAAAPRNIWFSTHFEFLLGL